MFKRLFGTKKNKEDEARAAEEAAEQKREDQLKKTTDSMSMIRSKMDELQRKINKTQSDIDTNMQQLKEMKLNGATQEQMKPLGQKVMKSKEEIKKYQNVLAQQQESLSTIDNVAFITEMKEVFETTNTALSMATQSIGDDIRDLMDSIADKKEEINDIMSIICQAPEEDDVDIDDLLGEIDAEIARDNNEATRLPAVPTSAPSIPQTVASKPAKVEVEDDLDAMLASL